MGPFPKTSVGPVHGDDSPAQVREGWLLAVIAHLQQTLAASELAHHSPTLTPVIRGVPLPTNRLEELVLGGLLLELAIGTRGLSPADLKDRTVHLGVIARARKQISVARRAAAHIEEHHRFPLNMRQLAISLGCDETGLRRTFRNEYHLSPREYHIRVRVQMAVRMLADPHVKIGAVAASVGYVSEKNFFRAVRHITGHSPAELRALTGTDLSRLSHALLPRPGQP